VYVNKALLTLLGLEVYEPATLIEAFFEKFPDLEVKESIMHCVSERTSGEIPEVNLGSKVYSFQFKAISSGDKDEQHVAGTVIFIRDITEGKLLERSKSELVAVASHQLRTPLTAMRGNVEMLLDESFGTLNKEQHELLDDVEVSTTRLITMVNDMLDITKIEKGQTEMVYEEVNLVEIVGSIVKDLDEYAKRHNFTIACTVPERKLIVLGDSGRLRQIFQNIIDNAVKYSRPPGTLDITFTHLGEGMVEVQLKDNGIGIPEAESSKMFGRFYRASNTSRVSSAGSGLGLYIVKSFIELMHGTIRFESIEGEGTTFFITLPTKNND